MTRLPPSPVNSHRHLLIVIEGCEPEGISIGSSDQIERGVGKQRAAGGDPALLYIGLRLAGPCQLKQHGRGQRPVDKQ